MKKYLPKFQNSGQVPKIVSKREATGFEIKPVLQPNNGVAGLDKSLQAVTRLNVSKPKASEDQSEKKSGSNVGKGLSSKGAGVMSAVSKGAGMATDLMSSAIDVDENSSFGTEQAVGDALLQSGNPYAMAAGAVVKLNSAMNQALGTNMNTISKKEANAVGVSGAGRILNNVAGFMGNIGIPGIGALFGKTDSVKMSEQTKSMSNAFAGSVDSIDTAEGMSGGRYVVGRDKINALIKEADRQNRLITDISVTNTQRKASDYGLDLAQQNLNRYAGNNYQNTHIGKHGMKLASVDEIKRILELKKQDEIQAFQNGGVIGIDVNVIPEGKYHAHKNHLGEINEEYEDLTKKGIPVVIHTEGGELEQVAEIEKMELIFRLEVTEKLEELFKDGSDEAMIEAGKLVAVEIMENTQDNSGEVLGDE